MRRGSGDSEPGAPVRCTGRERFASLFACALLLLTPFVIFLRHHDYPLFKLEIAVCCAALSAIGLGFGLLLTIAPHVLRAAIVALFLVLFADVQLDWIDSWKAVLVALFLLSLVLWPLRGSLGRVAATGSLIMIAATLPLPGGAGWSRKTSSDVAASDSSNLPPVIHLILDEHIGTEGIPPNFDRSEQVRLRMKALYQDHGFRLFGGAFSRYYATKPSLSYLFNFSTSPLGLPYLTKDGSSFSKNEYFEEMSRRGYGIHVYQSDTLDFCRTEGPIRLGSCLTYTLESIKAIENAPLSRWDKTQVIMTMFVRLSFLLSQGREAYNAAIPSVAVWGPELPIWHENAGRVSALSAMALLQVLRRELVEVGPGSLHLVHLMLPHFPFAYDQTCRLNPHPRSWLQSDAWSTRPRRNNKMTRANRYPLYLNQLECTLDQLDRLFEDLKTAGVLENAITIVHSDHGSRIDQGPPSIRWEKKLTPRDYSDAFSTLFAYKLPGGKAGYDRRRLPIDSLFSVLIRDGDVPNGTTWAGTPMVFLFGVNGHRFEWAARPMPPLPRTR